jgi:hypothetical protein
MVTAKVGVLHCSRELGLSPVTATTAYKASRQAKTTQYKTATLLREWLSLRRSTQSRTELMHLL